MSNKKNFIALRAFSFHGNTMEVDRYMGSFSSRDAAEAYTEKLYDSLAKLPAVKGLVFTFYVKDAEES